MTLVIVGINEKMLNLMPSRNGRLTVLKLLIFVFHLAFVILIFYLQSLNLFFRHLKRCIQDFHKKYVLVLADKVANNVAVV